MSASITFRFPIRNRHDLEIDLAGIQLLQSVRQFEAESNRIELLPVHDHEANAGAEWVYPDAWNPAGVEELGQFRAVNPIGADLLEGSVRAPAH